MAIINPLPYTIANGDPVDATPVQANLNQIVSNVNANAAAVAGNASQEFLVATTTNPAGAVPLAQAQSQFAALNGSATQNFSGAAISATSVASSGPVSGTTGTFSEQVSVGAAASGSTSAPQIAQTLGAGNTTVVLQSKSLSTTYTNNTGRPLTIYVQASSGVPPGNFLEIQLTINGTVVANEVIWNQGNVTQVYSPFRQFIIPVNATYNIAMGIGGVSSGVTLASWYEY